MSISSSTVSGKIKYKIVFLGNQHVGKTSIIDRFINDRFQNSYNATIGIDFLVKNMSYNNRVYRLQLWDTAGQQRFKSLIPSYLKDSHLCILVYDVGNLKSFQDIEKWMELYNEHKQYSAFCILVGNKSDVSTKQVKKQLVDQKLKYWKDLVHFTISAKSGEGVIELFHDSVRLIGQKLNNIKIIDQIEQKEEINDDGKGNQMSSKTVLEGNHKNFVLVNEKKESIQQKKKCC